MAARRWTITVPWDVHRTSDNVLRRLCWQATASRRKKARGVAHLAWKKAGSPVAQGRVRVSIVARRTRSMDLANVWGGAKPLLDGLFVQAMTPDDSARYLELGSVRLETGAQWRGREETVFEVEEL